MKKTTKFLAALSAVLCLSACNMDINVPNYNSVSAEDLILNPTPASLGAATQGLLSGARGLTANFVVNIGIWGRELYNLRPEEPRTITQQLIDPISGSTAFWSTPYSQIRNIRTVISAAEAVEALTDAERNAVLGFAYTLWAEALYHVILMHGDFGCPITTPDDPRELSPVVAEAEVYAEVLRLFDEGATYLQSGGSAFPFTMTDAMSDVATPAGFLQVNRALKVRTLKYMDRWTDVLATLPETFIDEAAPLTFGAWHAYSTNSGDNTNTLGGEFTVAYYAHPRFRADAQLQADGVTLDQRALDKTYTTPEFKLLGISATEKYGGWISFNSLSAPRSWIRNEELILIRAEANLAQGNDAAALDDVNLIRTTSGNLAPLSGAEWNALTDDEKLSEILYNKFMSLVLEGGFTYLDARQYGRLGPDGQWADWVPRAKEADTGADLGHVVFPRYPFPEQECITREIETSQACQVVVGF